MRYAALAALVAIAAGAAIVLYMIFAHSPDSTTPVSALIPTRTGVPATPAATPIPRTWIDGVVSQRGAPASPVLLSCLDTDRNGVIDTNDDSSLGDVAITLLRDVTCVDPQLHADFYAGTPSNVSGYSCDGDQSRAPTMIVVVASAGSDLLQPKEGESLGLIDVLNQIQARASAAGIATRPVLSTAAIFAADPPQTSMERWMEHYVSSALAKLPCLRAVIIGHSHGGVTVTSVTAALDDRYGDRMLGVLVDRTVSLYDRNAQEMPAATRLLNFFQTNEGWHGSALALPNVTDIDESAERAPIAPSDGGGGLALVSHKTLDDAPAVQQRIVDGVMAWLQRPAP